MSTSGLMSLDRLFSGLTEVLEGVPRMDLILDGG